MKRVLFDHNVPAELRDYCKPHHVRTAKEEGWRQLENGKLLAAADAAGFEVFVTADQNLQYQQNLAKRTLAVVILGTNDWETIERNPGPIAVAIDTGVPGKAVIVEYPKPIRRPRPLGGPSI